MKIIYIILSLLSIGLTGCSAEFHSVLERQINRPDIPLSYKVKIIDGCEYIIVYTEGMNYIPTHKGNCTNKIHIYNIEKTNL